jgi:hypothetical protein
MRLVSARRAAAALARPPARLCAPAKVAAEQADPSLDHLPLLVLEVRPVPVGGLCGHNTHYAAPAAALCL